jgi:cytochrome b561
VQLRDTGAGYGLVTRLAHWLMAVAFFFMFALGLWMVGLDYYNPYYTSAPDLHRSLGILFAAALIARFVWVQLNAKPSNSGLSRAERVSAAIVQWSFYPLLLAISISGYLIATTDGRAVDVFGLFSLPAIITDRNMTDASGFLHRWLSYGTLALAGLHTVAALKHHFWDRNDVLKRMLSGPPRSQPNGETSL